MARRLTEAGSRISTQRWRLIRSALLAGSAVALYGSQARGQVQFVASQGDLTDPNSWAGGVVPGATSVAAINNAGTAGISGSEALTIGELRVGDVGGSNFGELIQDGGTITDLNWFVVARDSTGLYQMSGGSLIKSGGGMFIVLGGTSTQQGLMQMSGTASVALINSGNAAIGDAEFFGSANAQLSIQDSASFNASNSQFWVGNAAGAIGNVDMTGGTLTCNSWMSVGRTGGTGSIDISGGAINKTGDNSTHFIVGDSNNGSAIGTGTINQTGGVINSTSSDFWLGSSGNAAYNIAGGTLNTLALDMGINGGSTAVLNLNGGAVAATVVSKGSGSATINFNGGVLQPRQSNSSFLQNFNSSDLNVLAGGAIFDTGGFTNTISTGLQGVGGLTLQGSGGSITLSTSNTYSGPTTVNGGVLIIGSAGTLGTGTAVNLNGGALAIPSDATISGKTLTFGGGALQLQNYNSSAISFTNAGGVGLGAATGTASSFAGLISGSTTLNYVGPGTLNLTNPANSYTGGTVVSNGVLQASPGSLGTGTVTLTGTGLLGISSDGSIPGNVVFSGGGVSFNNYSSALNFNPGINLTLGAATGAASTLTGVISNGPSSPTSLTYVGPGTLNLLGSNTYTGGTNISSGTLNFASNTLGTGAIYLNNATLQYAPGNTQDVTSSPFGLTVGPLGGTIDTNGNNVTFAGAIQSPSSGTSGIFQKAGAGTLTLQGTFSNSTVYVHQGTLALNSSAAVTTTSYVSIGYTAGDNGNLLLAGSSTLTDPSDLNIADQNGSSGSMTIQDNATLQVHTLYVGKSGTATGSVIQTGGAVVGIGASDWRIGGGGSAADSAAVGVYNLSGGTITTNSNFQPGAYGKGTFIQTGGTVTVNNYLSIGRFPGGVGLYDMSSGNGIVIAAQQPVAVVGEQGNGTLLVGGSSTFNAKKLLIAQNDGATGLVLQSGGTLNVSGGVAFGQNQTGSASSPAIGTFTLSGGILQTAGFSQFSTTNLTGIINFNGGTWVATQGGASLISGVSHAVVQAGGLNLNASAGAVTLTQPLLHDPTAGAPAVDGGVTLLAGQLTMNGSSSGFTGATVITNGSKLIAGAVNTLSPFSAINLASGTLDVSGFNNSIGGITVGSSGVLDTSTATGAVLTDTGSATFGGTLNIAGAAPTTYPYTLMTYTGFSGNFASASLPAGTFLAYTPTALELTNSAVTQQSLVYLNTNLNWDTAATAAFNGASGPTVFHTGDFVTFNDANPAGPYTVTISGTVSPGSTTFNNSAGNYVVNAANSSSGIAGSGALNKQGSGMVTLAGSNTYTGGTNVQSGTLKLASANAFPASTALSVSSGGQLTIGNHGSSPTYIVKASSFTNAGTVDVINNAMDLPNSSYAAAWSQVQAGFGNGTWTGTRSTGGVITSSMAATDPTHLTAVGIATGLTRFEGQAVSASDVLVKYTYYGDANLDGQVDGSDYTLIDNGFNNHLTGWVNGDFNYDGVIDGSDYTLIDNAFNTQGAVLAAQVAGVTAQVAGSTAAAVPEPVNLAIVTFGAAAAVLGPRRLRRSLPPVQR